MSSFRFNFSTTDTIIDHSQTDENREEIQWLESEELVPDTELRKLNGADHARMFTCGEVEIGHVVAKEALTSLANGGLNAEMAEREHSDLVPGRYEGGLKIWECTSDLIEYLDKHKDEIMFKDTNVLDLGCGAGLLGIYAFMHGADVTFQDYNKEVLQCVTIPNFFLNIEEDDNRETKITRCKFYSGDWASFDTKLSKSTTYDIILTSETVYNTHNYEKLVNLFINRLSKDGVIYLAAKTYYFGVGGGTRQFEEALEKNGQLQSEICWKSIGGIQREILKITRKS